MKKQIQKKKKKKSTKKKRSNKLYLSGLQEEFLLNSFEQRRVLPQPRPVPKGISTVRNIRLAFMVIFMGNFTERNEVSFRKWPRMATQCTKKEMPLIPTGMGDIHIAVPSCLCLLMME